MQKPNLTKWTISAKTQGILFFASLVDELLFDFTIDTFKIPALNTKSLCEELDIVLYEIENEVLQEGNKDAIIEELILSAEKDPVVRYLLSEQFVGYCKELRTASSLPKIRTLVTYLRNKIEPQYFETCKKLLREKIESGTEKEVIVRLTRTFLNELIFSGYSSEYIYFENDRYFFSGRYPSKIDSFDVIDNYFNRFKIEPKKWNVLFRVSDGFGLVNKFPEKIKISITKDPPALKLTKDPDNLKKFLSDNPSYPLYLTIQDIEALDTFKSRERGEDRLSSMHGLFKYHAHRPELSWSRTGLVYSEERDYFHICKPPREPILKRPDMLLQKLESSINKTISTLTRDKLDFDSWYRLIKALELHRLAIVSKNFENQILNLWTAIEILFPPKVGVKASRIEQIINQLVPFISTAYVAKLSSCLLGSLKMCKQKEVMEILNQVDDDVNLLDKTTLLFALEKNKRFREKYYKLFENTHPLLVNRIYFLNNKFSSAKNIEKALNNHMQRVSWHIQRIYRTRNMIIHSGKALPYLGILVENLHSYLDRAFDIIFEFLTEIEHKSSIDEMALEVRLNLENHLMLLKRNKSVNCDNKNYKMLLYGNARSEKIDTSIDEITPDSLPESEE